MPTCMRHRRSSRSTLTSPNCSTARASTGSSRSRPSAAGSRPRSRRSRGPDGCRCWISSEASRRQRRCSRRYPASDPNSRAGSARPCTSKRSRRSNWQPMTGRSSACRASVLGAPRPSGPALRRCSPTGVVAAACTTWHLPRRRCSTSIVSIASAQLQTGYRRLRRVVSIRKAAPGCRSCTLTATAGISRRFIRTRREPMISGARATGS